jgi:hypothetical protein
LNSSPPPSPSISLPYSHAFFHLQRKKCGARGTGNRHISSRSSRGGSAVRIGWELFLAGGNRNRNLRDCGIFECGRVRDARRVAARLAALGGRADGGLAIGDVATDRGVSSEVHAEGGGGNIERSVEGRGSLRDGRGNVEGAAVGFRAVGAANGDNRCAAIGGDDGAYGACRTGNNLWSLDRTGSRRATEHVRCQTPTLGPS